MNGTAEDKKYGIAIAIAIGSIFLFAVALVLIAMQLVPLLMRNMPTRSRVTMAGVYLGITGDFTSDFSVSTVVNVPPPTGVHSEPSLQFAAYAPLEHHSWEAGIIRGSKYGYRAEPYVSESAENARYQVLYLSPVSDGPHRIALSRSGRTLRFMVDGKLTYTFVHGPALPNAPLQVGITTAIGRTGELASGSVSDLRIHEREVNFKQYHYATCSFGWGGVALIPSGSRWVLEGRSDPAELYHRVRHCRSSS